MNKLEFMNKLSNSLVNISNEEKNDILYDYEEHFRIAMENGKSEEAAAESLGDPSAIAKYYKASAAINKAESEKSVRHIFKASGTVIGLGFFNLVFILGPYIGIIGVLIGLYAASFGLALSGLLGAVVAVFQTQLPVNQGAVIFAMIGICCLGLLMLIGNIELSKKVYKMTIKYLKFNLNLIKR